MTLANKPASEMTLLEHYAGLALQGIVADGQPGAWELIAAQAVKGAAALVAELEKRQPKPEPVPEPALPDGWQPMSTAPKDRWIEGLSFETFDMRWSERCAAWLDGNDDEREPRFWREVPQ